jgi:hypothetical protein
MKFISLLIILNWSSIKNGTEMQHKEIYMKANTVTAINGDRKTFIGKSKEHYIGCEIEANGRTYMVWSDCQEVKSLINERL